MVTNFLRSADMFVLSTTFKKWLTLKGVSLFATSYRFLCRDTPSENLWDVINSNRTVVSTKENIAATVFRPLQQVSWFPWRRLSVGSVLHATGSSFSVIRA